MTRSSCKIRGITLKSKGLEFCPFSTKILSRMMAFDRQALIRHAVLLLSFEIFFLCFIFLSLAFLISYIILSNFCLLINFVIIHISIVQNQNSSYKMFKINLFYVTYFIPFFPHVCKCYDMWYLNTCTITLMTYTVEANFAVLFFMLTAEFRGESKKGLSASLLNIYT